MNRTTLVISLACAIAFSSLTVCSGAEAIAPKSKIMLFDGKSFDGLFRYLRNNQGDVDETWKIKPNGILACAGEPRGYIRTTKSYKNYKFHMEYRWPGKPGNNGVLVHMVGEDKVWPKSLECQGGFRNQGDFWEIGGWEFNEHKVGLGYSHQIHFVSLGIQINYIQFNIDGYGSSGLVVLEFGGIVKILPELRFGAYIFNPAQSDPYHDRSGILPMLLKAGLSYRPVPNLMLNIEYHYYLYIKRSLSIGLEYVIREKVAVRTGINLWTQRSTFGIGFSPGKFQINYAVDVHPLLGISHEFSVTFKISKE